MKQWNIDKAYFWESAPFFRILLPFVAGIICYDRGWLKVLHLGFQPILFFVFIGLVLIFIFFRKSNLFVTLIGFLSLNIVLFLSGFAVTDCNDIKNDKDWFGRRLNQVSIARITDFPAQREHSWRMPVSILGAVKNGKVSPSDGRAIVYIAKDSVPMQLHKGDTVLLPAKWQPIKNAGNPFEFDYTGYCKRNNLHFRQFSPARSIKVYGASKPEYVPFIERAHDWSMNRLDSNIRDSTSKGLIQAMLLGDEINLDEQLIQSWAETGIVHIIAISGGNVVVFFLVISWLLFWMRNRKHLWIKYLVSLPLVWFYVLMAGGAPSAIRAAIMFSLFAFSIFMQKPGNSLNQLFATAFILLFAQPMWLFAIGFQLSFVAVLSIVLFYQRVYKWFTPGSWIVKKIWETIAASISAEILVAPLVVYYFHNFPVMFLVANVIALLFMGVVQVLGMTIVALWFWPWMAKILGLITTFLVIWFNKIVLILQSMNPEYFHFLRLTVFELLVLYLAIAGFSYFLVRRKKGYFFLGLGGCCLLLLSFCIDEWQDLHQQRLVIYNAGSTNYIERIHGKHYSVLQSDSSAGKKIMYSINPAHINWQAWRQVCNVDSKIEAMQVAGKTILILKDGASLEGQFHVDYLLVDDTGKIDLLRLQHVFTPKKIIIGNNISGKQFVKRKSMVSDTAIHLHRVREQGAFVIGGRDALY